MMPFKVKSEWIPVSFSDDVHVKATMSPREGGVSSGPYGNVDGVMGLNVGDHVGDHPSCVAMNRAIVAEEMGAPVIWLHQVHGAKVVMAPVPDGTEADAIVSQIRDVTCAVMVADCLPILMTNVSGKVVAAVHGGWRPLAQGIIHNTVEAMRTLTDEPLFAWIGPGISAQAFEVGPEVVEALKAATGETDEVLGWATPGQGDRWHVNLALVAGILLAKAGVKATTSLLTTDSPVHFYSYRRDGQKTGRHVALIRANG